VPLPGRLADDPYEHLVLALGDRGVLFQREGQTASVLVREDARKIRKLVINSRTNASDSASDMATQVLLAQLPFLFAPRTDRVFVVGDGRIRDEIVLGRREDHAAGPLITRLAQLGL